MKNGWISYDTKKELLKIVVDNVYYWGFVFRFGVFCLSLFDGERFFHRLACGSGKTVRDGAFRGFWSFEYYRWAG